MNDLTFEAIHQIDQQYRNIIRFHAWAERWARKFGTYPPSWTKIYAFCLDHRPEPKKPAADILVHPALFERHGNQGIVRFPRRRGQLHVRGRLPDPPEAA